MGNAKLRFAVRAAIVTAAASSAIPFAHSQTAPATGAANGGDEGTIQEVVVTGSRLAQSPNDVSISPVTSLGELDIQKQGLVRTEDLLNNLPQVVSEQSGGTSISSNGTATVSLRGLGSQRTLVLVNGTRLAPGAGLGATTTSSADINQIPSDLISRVDVLTGGASAVYGADAVAGVVNFVLNTTFEGVKIDANYGFGRYSNDHSDLLGYLSSSGNPLPQSTVDAGFNKDVTVIMGGSFADGKGHATVYGSYLRTSPAVGYQYDYAGCSLNTPSTLPGPGGLSCGGSGTPATGRFALYGLVSNGAGGTKLSTLTPASAYGIDPTTGQLSPYNSSYSYNYGALSYLQRAAERYSSGAFLTLDINDNVSAYSNFMFARNSSSANYGPSGLFTYTAANISCANPLLTAAEVSTFCSPANIAANQAAFGTTGDRISLYVGRRSVESGPRADNYTSNSFRETLGFKGKIIEGLTFDTYAQVGINEMRDSESGFIDTENALKALDVVTDPTTGQPACASYVAGTDKNCVPWNIYSANSVTQAALNYISVPASYTVTTKEYIVDSSVTADLGKWGLKIPTASVAPSINVGGEYRSESYVFDPDYIFANGLNSGGNGAQHAIDGGFHVFEVFTEGRLPVLSELPGAYDLSFDAGYRYSSYTSGFNTNTYKFGVEFAPIKDVKLRGSYNRAVRAPGVGDLYAPSVIGAGGTADPCWGPVIGGTGGTTGTIQGHDFAYCSRTGVTAAEWGSITANPAAQINTATGGNSTLKPEKADTFSYGFVIQPSAIPNLVVSADFYYIKIQDTIVSLSSNTIINNCGLTGDATLCSYIHRGAGTGSLWFNTTNYVTATEQNIGSISTKGIDLSAHYTYDTGGYGKLGWAMSGTRLLHMYVEPIPGQGQYDCAGYWGTTCSSASPASGPLPKWRHVMSVDWMDPWLGSDLSVRWRYIGASQSDHTSQNDQLAGTYYEPNARIGGYTYIDLSYSMPIPKSGIDVRVGVNNITDKRPPIVASGNYSECPNTTCNDNTWVGTYDTLGRYLYAHVSVKF